MGQHTASALKNGNVKEAELDVLLARLFKVRIRLGHFDPPGPLQAIGADQVCSPYALELARDGARQGSVLVKNAAGLLPLDASKFQSAAVIGPNAHLTNTIYYYGGRPCAGNGGTAVDAIKQHIAATTSALGVPTVGSSDTSGVGNATALAAAVSHVQGPPFSTVLFH